MHLCTPHIQYHPIKYNVQKHFKLYVKLHFIFHQTFWMATLLTDSNNSLTSLLEQKRMLKKSKLQHLYRLARWQFDLPWNFKSFVCAGAGGLLVVNNQSLKHHETCCFAEKAHRNCFFWGPWFQQNGSLFFATFAEWFSKACWIWVKHITIRSNDKVRKPLFWKKQVDHQIQE